MQGYLFLIDDEIKALMSFFINIKLIEFFNRMKKIVKHWKKFIEINCDYVEK